MRPFTTSRLFAALAITATLIAWLMFGGQAAAVIFLSLTLLSLAPSCRHQVGVATFTTSEQFLQYMQGRFGSANFSQWQSIRWQFYSFVNYPVGGQVAFNFFGFAPTGNAAQNQQYTNMQTGGSLANQYLLLKSVQTGYYISTAVNQFSCPLASGVYTDVNNPAADMLYGLYQAGYFELDIGAKPYVQVAKPFLYLPPADGETVNVAALGISGTAAGGSSAIDTFHSLVAYADLNRNKMNRYLVDPAILIEPQQALTCTIGYPSGAIPIIDTNIFGTNLFIGVILDGILFRPTQ